MERIRVMIVDKQIFFRNGLCQALSGESDLELLDYDPAQNLITAVEDESPDVLLLDIDYPLLSGLRLSRRVVCHFPNTSVVMLSPNPTDEELIKVIKSGAAAYLSKNSSAEGLVKTIRQVSRGEYPINDILAAIPNATEYVVKQFRDMALMGKAAHGVGTPITLRETQTLSYVAGGKTNKEIGQILQISEQTVKSHISSVLLKLNASHRAHAVALAIRNGWITGEEDLSEQPWPKVHVR